MKTLLLKSGAVLLTWLFFLPLALSEEDGASFVSHISGEAGVTFRVVDGEDESAKFEEYRDIPEPISGEVEIRYDDREQYFFGIDARDIGEQDQDLHFTGGWYGKIKLDVRYNQIPHRFAFDAKTLHTGVGSGNLSVPDAVQSNLQGSATSIDLANRLNTVFSGAASTDIELFREKGELSLDFIALEPFSLRVELKKEDRDGEKPFFGSFGFANTVEIPEPIDYDTTDVKVVGEYARRPLYLSASYYLSVFENNIDTLTWDNPFRRTDSTTPLAFLETFAAGPSQGRIDLAPDNQYHNVSLTGSLMELPLNSRISTTASWGWMRQDDALSPFTTNTAIVPGAANSPPFDASDPANLPQREADADVQTSLYHVRLTSNPLRFMHVNGKFRYYEYDNDTDRIRFPGHVLADAVWQSEPMENLPTSYDKTTAGVDFGFDVFKRTRLTLGYTFDQTKRTHREVSRQQDHIFNVAVDTQPFSWLDFRTSYERTERDINHYDSAVPFGGQIPNTQLPFLRKHTQADVVRDRIQFLATVYPMEPLAVSGSFIYGEDAFKDSPFGLLEDKHHILSFDADYAVTEQANVYAFYSYEKYRNKESARQWNPGGTGDPFLVETTRNSASNWSAESEDIIHTVGGGLNVGIIPEKLDFDVSYSFSDVDGKLEFFSPLGASDTNAFVPLDFITVDETRFHMLKAQLQYRVWKGLSVALGYLWERFDFADFNKEGLSNIPTTGTGAFNGALLMGTLPEDYDVNVVYTRIAYRF